MKTLEKILKEIDNHATEFESFGMCDDYVSLGWVKEIIHKYMNNHSGNTNEMVEEDTDHIQPELPLMKNNNQRKEWLRNYQDWGLWYEDEHIGAKYYRYEFENGAVLIAEEYECGSEYIGDYVSSYLHLIGGPESPKGVNGVGKWQMHEKYNRHPNGETELVEFLKEIQKNNQKR